MRTILPQSPLGRGTGFNSITASAWVNVTTFQSPLGRGTGFNPASMLLPTIRSRVSVPSWSGNGLQPRCARESAPSPACFSPLLVGERASTSGCLSFLLPQFRFSPLLVGERASTLLADQVIVRCFGFSPLLVGERASTPSRGAAADFRHRFSPLLVGERASTFRRRP